MSSQLAVNGGTPVIAEGVVQPWPPIDDTDRAMVVASLDGHQHVFGANHEAFEKEFAAWNGNKHVALTISGTSALHMCVAACGCGVGDEVIVPAWSWPSSATCVLHNDAIPVFVDINFATMNMDVDKIEQAITPKTKAILVVHLHGLCMPMDTVMDIADRHGLMVIEDCCQGHGATYKGKRAGTWGHCSGFSCNQNKLLCAGESGFFVTDDETLFKKGKMLGSYGALREPSDDPNDHAYSMGYKYNSNDLVAAFGRAQLAKLDGYLKGIRENIAMLEERLKRIPGLILPIEPEDCVANWYNYTVRFDAEALGWHDRPEGVRETRDKVVKALNAEGAPNAAWQRFALPAMPVFRAKNAYGQGHPWSSPHAQPVDYSLDQYPQANRHCDTHTCLVAAVRPPNGPDVAKLIADAFEKVMSHLDEL